MAKLQYCFGILSMLVVHGIDAPDQTIGAEASTSKVGQSRSSVREQVEINDGWLMAVDLVRSSRAPFFCASQVSPVDLPHTLNASDGQDGGGDYRRTTTAYLRRIAIPVQSEGRRVFLRIGAANIVARVLVNGQAIGVHRGGFSAFVFELTGAVRWGQLNDLMVFVNNAPDKSVPPYSADFTFFGGIYRDVSLLFTGPLCVSPLDYASAGMYLRVERMDAVAAKIAASIKLNNADSTKEGVRLRLELTDLQGEVVAKSETTPEAVPPGNSMKLLSLVVRDPRLWKGVADPYLYTATLSLFVGDRVVDRVEEPFGIRTFNVDPDKGFTLNGEPYRLYGVNRHQDRENLGWAIRRTHHDEDFAMIREMGCTAVRLAHYQHDPYVYDLCDRLGLVVWAEIPLINRVVDAPGFRENSRQQLIELIRQNYNHPSICFWGVHNEITAPWEPGPDPAPLVTELAALVEQEDPTRRSVCAGTSPDEHPANWQTELVAFNRYFGWYHESADDFGAWIDQVHERRPLIPIGISEYGAGANIEHHALPPKKPRHDGPWHPEEYQALFHEVHWQQIQARPYIWCSFVWSMFDFASDQRNEGGTPGRNDKGLVTYDRRTKKDSFYWYKANWSKEPFVHITSRRLERRDNPIVSVKVYSNCSAVSISVGDKLYAAKRSNDHIFEWPDAQLSKGKNMIHAVGTFAGKTVSDECLWYCSAPE
ncbi:MAG: beta-galactosidase [Phycisphaerae bacterium]|nr:MAG: beta-galactosidase [Phycisphaerae bacterium]